MTGTFTWRMLATVLGGESLVIFFGALLARGMPGGDGVSSSADRWFVPMGVLAAVTLVTAGLLIGGVAAAPFGAWFAKKIPAKTLLLLVGIVLTATSFFSLYKAIG